MSNYAILRVAKVQGSRLAGLAKHHSREQRPANADQNAPKPQMPVPATSAQVMARVRAAIEAHNATGRKLQKNSPVALDLFIGMSKSQGKAKDDEYFRNALAWIEARYGKENILLAAIHRDETTPHMQCLVMPRIDGRFQASKVLGDRGDFKKMQDSFFEAAGRPAGLDRGLRESKAQHIEIKRFYAALSTGAQIPPIQKVPAAPGWLDRVLHPKAAAELAERRAAAIAANTARRKLIEEKAKVAGQVHPEIIRRTAEQYRAAKAAQEHAKINAAAAQKDLVLAQQIAAQPARLIAQALKLLDQPAVDRISAAIGQGVELKAGRDLIDQLRRQGKCRGLADGLELIKTAVEASAPSPEKGRIRAAFEAPRNLG